MVLHLSDSWSNWNLKMLVFGVRRGENRSTRRKNLSEQGREPTTNSTHKWRQRPDLNLGPLVGGECYLAPPLPSPQLILEGNVWRSDGRICMWMLGLESWRVKLLTQYHVPQGQQRTQQTNDEWTKMSQSMTSCRQNKIFPFFEPKKTFSSLVITWKLKPIL